MTTQGGVNGWPKYDPHRGFWLCESCWNRGPQGLEHHCEYGMCDCPCTNMQPPPRVKFSREGQLKIDMSNPLIIRKDS